MIRMIISILVILAGYVINSPLVAIVIYPEGKFVPGVVALSISIGFIFALFGGYLIADDTQNRRLKIALIITVTFILGLLLVIFVTKRESPAIQAARFVAMLTGVALGAYLKTPEIAGQLVDHDDKRAPIEQEAEVRFKESNVYIRHIFDNLVRWFTFFVTVNYVSMGWFATSARPSNMLPLIAGLFAIQNFLGILMCMGVKAYIASVRFGIMKNEAVGIGVAFPDRVYVRAVNLMMVALLTILVVWLVLPCPHFVTNAAPVEIHIVK